MRPKHDIRAIARRRRLLEFLRQIGVNDFNGDGVPDDNVTSAPSEAQLGTNGIGTCTVTQDSSALPPFSATLQSEYSLPISDRTDAFLRGLFSFYGKSDQNPNLDYDDIDAYGLLNLYTGVRDPDGQWEVSLYGKNIFDVTKATYQDFRQTLNYSFGLTSASYTAPYNVVRTTAPQEFGVNVRFAFGSR